MYRFIFIGGTKRGYELLRSLIKGKRIPKHAFVLKEDESETEKYSERITGLLEDKKVPFGVCKKLSEDDYKIIENLKPDMILVFGWRSLINAEINSHVKKGIIAAHYSLLPKYRGFAPLQWAIINGEKETGVTLFLISEGETDSGGIIAQENVTIDPDEYAINVDKKLTDSAIIMFNNLFESPESNKIPVTKQIESEATYTCKRIPEDGKIDWRLSSESIYNLIRALAHPYTGAFCTLNEKIYHIRKARPGDMNGKIFAGNIPGRVIMIDDEGVEVLCGSGSLKIEEWENKSEKIISNPNSEINSIAVTLK